MFVAFKFKIFTYSSPSTYHWHRQLWNQSCKPVPSLLPDPLGPLGTPWNPFDPLGPLGTPWDLGPLGCTEVQPQQPRVSQKAPGHVQFQRRETRDPPKNPVLGKSLTLAIFGLAVLCACKRFVVYSKYRSSIGDVFWFSSLLPFNLGPGSKQVWGLMRWWCVFQNVGRAPQRHLWHWQC